MGTLKAHIRHAGNTWVVGPARLYFRKNLVRLLRQSSRARNLSMRLLAGRQVKILEGERGRGAIFASGTLSRADLKRIESRMTESIRPGVGYRKWSDIRIDSITELYRARGADLDRHFPSILGPQWSSNIGHIALAAMLLVAEDFGFVPKVERTQIITQIGNQEALRALSHRYRQRWIGPNQPLLTRELAGLMDRGALVPLGPPYVEDLMTVKTRGGFIDLYSLLENIGVKLAEGEKPEPFNLSRAYMERVEHLAGIAGIDLHQPTMALHVRESWGTAFDQRSVERDTYLPAIREAIKLGYQVVRFGGDRQTPFPEITGLTDLVAKFPGDNSLDLYFLTRATFLLSTQSGPVSISLISGIPVLGTNYIHIGLTAHSAEPGTIYLPKRLISGRGSPMSLGETLRLEEDHWRNVEGRAPTGLALNNTSEEIRQGVIEMISSLKSGKSPSGSAALVNEIRNGSPSIGRGNFAESFLALHPEWLN